MDYVLLSRAQRVAVTHAQSHPLHSLRDVINSKVRVSFEKFRCDYQNRGDSKAIIIPPPRGYLAFLHYLADCLYCPHNDRALISYHNDLTIVL